MADAPPTCEDLKAAYLSMLLTGGEVLIKAGSQLVKYTDIDRLRQTIELLCGPIMPEGTEANRGMAFSVARFSRNCGCRR